MITEKIDSALSAVFEHFYSYMPEFEDGEEPEKYAVYNLSEIRSTAPVGQIYGSMHCL